MSRNKRLAILIVAALICTGVYGLMTSTDMDVWDATFKSILMFTGGFGDSSKNLYVNIARYGALAFSATIILSLLNRVAKGINDFFKSKKKNALFVYGNNSYSEEFMNDEGYTFVNRDDYLKMKKYILLSDEDDNFDFYNKNLKGKDCEVFLKSESFSIMILDNGNLHLFSLDEMSAKRYLEEYPFIECADKDELNIVMIGFNELSEELLRKMLVVNVFNPNQRINYHVFNDEKEVLNTYINKEKLNIICHDDSYLNHLDLLNSSDRIIITENVVEHQDIVRLVGCLERGNISIVANRDMDENLFNQHRSGTNVNVVVKCFNSMKGICNPDMILNESSLNKAKTLNDKYNEKHPEYGGHSWEDLDSFARFSNIASADYYDLTVKPLLEKMTGKKYGDITDDEFAEHLELLAMNEHIRWSNFHLLNNWKYSETKDKKHKKHDCLIPFDDLSEEKKQLDRNQIMEMREIEN